MKKRLISLMLVFFCLLSLVGCGGETSEPVESDNPPTSSSVLSDSTDVAYSGDLAFYVALPDKSVCEDKTIEVTGEYTDKTLGIYYIGDILDDFYVGVTFEDKTDAVKQLEEGDIITVRGVCFDPNDDSLLLNHCELISVTKPDTSSEPVTEPTENPKPSTDPRPTETPKPSTDPQPTENPKPSTDPQPTENPKPSTDPQPTDTPTPPENSTFSIHFIDVGQADAALVECDGHYMLIDGGNKADSNVIYSVLKKASVPKLDIVVGTHAHEDHIGGLPGAFNYTTADLTLCSGKTYDSDAFNDFARYANQKGGGITIPKKGDIYALGSATVTILGLNGGSDTNDTSIILRIDYGETSFLFTGDAELAAEQAVLNAGANLSATVLKVGHHGSDTSTSYRFLREIMPSYAVISVGDDNTYGHPMEAVLSRLRDADVTVFRTDMQGDIFCTSDGKNVTFTVERNANADTLIPNDHNTLEDLQSVMKSSSKGYNSSKNKILDGTLTYAVISTTEIELFYKISELVYADTEYLVDDVMDQILEYVIDDLNEAELPEVVTVSINASYDLSDEESASAPSDDPEPSEEPQEPVRDYVYNKSTKKFHYPDCRSVKQMKENNKGYITTTRSDMISRGYSPCGNCKP